MNESFLVEEVEKKYLSFEFPRFDFVRKEISKNIYRDIFEFLEGFYCCEDITDLNFDVSLRVSLKKAENCQSFGVLEVSFVGKYFFYIGEESCLDEAILNFLKNKKIVRLEEGFLKTKFPFAFSGETVNYYKILFSSIEMFPWE